MKVQSHIKQCCVAAFLPLGFPVGLLLMAESVEAATRQVLPPQSFTTKTGTPVPVTITFTACIQPGALRLVSYNGGVTNEFLKVESARIVLNGVEVVHEQDWANAPDQIVREVELNSSNTLTVYLEGDARSGLTVQIVRDVAQDGPGPRITLAYPPDSVLTGDTLISIAGRVHSESRVALTVNGQRIPVETDGAFLEAVPLRSEGGNILDIVATDSDCNQTDTTRTVYRDTRPPTLLVSSPQDTTTDAAEIGFVGTVTDQTALSVKLNGFPIPIGPEGGFSGTTGLAFGPNTLTFVAKDAQGHIAKVTRSVMRTFEAGELPPDPVLVATPIDPTRAEPFIRTVEFLYLGKPRIQTGVDPQTIDPVRAAVLRGKVKLRNGEPLPGVEIAIVGHPEFGSTKSRADGMFDLVVNGGGPLTIQYVKDGFLPAQRNAYPSWRMFAMVEDVILVGMDPHVTTVDFTQPITVARGSMSDDSDGSRQATMLFKAGTQASLVMPDGSTQPLSTIHVRATEFTVGASGPEAMPALLPPRSAYTYAIEPSVDEALAARAQSVHFDRDVPFYLENYRGFPVGAAIPVGFYNRALGRWIAERDGRIIKILSIVGGAAEIDVNGDDQAENPDSLAQLGIDSQERATLAGLYSAGQSLWRVAVNHFSPYDLNWPLASIAEAPDAPDMVGDDSPDNPCEARGSIIECQSQTLREGIALAGTPFALNYSSSRVDGRKAARSLAIPVSSGAPEALRSIRVRVEVAGTVTEDSLPPRAYQVYHFTWNGVDAYGRVLQGAQPALVKLGYTTDLVRLLPVGFFGRAFGRPCFGVCYGVPDSIRFITRWREIHTVVVALTSTPASQLGGWSVDVHHAYDPVAGVLYQGNGRRISQGAYGGVVKTLSDTLWGSSQTTSQAVAPDGSIYFSALFGEPNFAHSVQGASGHRVLRHTRDGGIHQIAGNGAIGFGGDSVRATDVPLNSPTSITLAPDGEVFFVESVDFESAAVRRIDANGLIHTVAGAGDIPNAPDGTPARRTKLAFGAAVAVGREKDVFISEPANHRILYIDDEGILRVFAGTGVAGNDGDGGSARLARITYPRGVGVGPDGSVYFGSGAMPGDEGNSIIRRVGVDGMISTLVDNQADFLHELAIASDGSLFTRTETAIWHVARDGSVQVFAGAPGVSSVAPIRENTLRLGARFYGRGLAVGHEGRVVGGWSAGILEVGPVAPGFSLDEYSIPSPEGRELYLFDGGGRHVRTYDALTGAVRYRFEYDARGRLTRIVDFDGNATTIERDGSGAPQAIVGPYGQRTTVAVDANGYLATVVNALGETIHLSHTSDGLLTDFRDPRGNAHAFSYDGNGRLIRDEDAEGGYSVVSRSRDGRQVTIERTSALGRTTRYVTERLQGGDVKLDVTNPAGLTATTTRYQSAGLIVTRLRDGTVDSVYMSPDPRFGMAAPIVSRVARMLPSGSTSVTTLSREVSADPSRWLGVSLLADLVIVNGRTYRHFSDPVTLEMTDVSPLGLTTVARFDSVGRIREFVKPGVEPMEYSYDGRGRLSEVRDGARLWRYVYDPEGRLSSVTDPLGQITSRLYDGVGRLATLRLPDNTETTVDHDASGNVVGLTPPGRTRHGFTFDGVDRPLSYVPPIAAGSGPTLYAYDDDGAPSSVTHSDGQGLIFGYDAAGRPSTTVVGSTTVGYAYDVGGGQLTAITRSNSCDLALEYDGSRVTRWESTGLLPGRMDVFYDLDGFPATETVVGGGTVSYSYNDDKELTSAGALRLAIDPATGFLTRTTLGIVATEYTYNSHGELASITARAGAAELLSRALERDSLGRIAAVRERTLGGPEKLTSYGYDLGSRLTTVAENGTNIRSYAYDVNGNRIRLTGISPTDTTGYTTDEQDRLLRAGSTTLGYDAAGFLAFHASGVDTTRYEYDRHGDLLSVALPNAATITYKVDGLGRRRARYVNGLFSRGWLYGGRLHPVAEVDSTGAVRKQFCGPFRARTPGYILAGGETLAVISDERGSPRLIVNATTGAVDVTRDYDEFGNTIQDSDPLAMPFGFAGGVVDEATNLVRFGARDYDPRMGRWNAKDPIGFKAGDTNLYGYVYSNPLNAVDVQGTSPEDVEIIAQFFAAIVEDMSAAGMRLEIPHFNNMLATFEWGNLLGCTDQSTYMQEMLELALEGLTEASWMVEVTWGALYLNDSRTVFPHNWLVLHPNDPTATRAGVAITDPILRVDPWAGTLIAVWPDGREEVVYERP